MRQLATLQYDVQGNVANNNGVAYGFDYGNRLRTVQGKGIYRYDGYGRRVLNYSPTTGNLIYQYDFAGQLMYQRNTRTGHNTRTDYIYLGGSLVAEREQDLAVTGYPVTIRYQHTDALGTPVAVSDANGLVTERSEYEPYGKLLNRPIHDGPGFTGQVEDADTGLTYMQQRYYDPGIGRFLSVDPVTANGNTGVNFNRYWYADDNPYKFTDPDGRQANEGTLGTFPNLHSDHMCEIIECGRNSLLPGYRTLGLVVGGRASAQPHSPAEAAKPMTSAQKLRETFAGAGLLAGWNEYANKIEGMWRGANGKWYSMAWGGNQWTGARSTVMNTVRSAQRLGAGLMVVNLAFDANAFAKAAGRGDGSEMFNSTVSAGWDVAGEFGGPAGLVGAASYGATSRLMEFPTVRGAVVTPLVDVACQASGC